MLVLTAACRSQAEYRAPVGADAHATYRAIEADGENGIAKEDETLWRCELGSAAMAIGNEDVAFKALHTASRSMGTLESTTTENARAILGSEATKMWKGDPHERSMNALYKGLLYWRRGELGNASACFKRGLLADAYSEAGEHQKDFAVLMFLLGWVSHVRGQEEQARYSFKEAAETNHDNPYLQDPRPEAYNILVVADIGIGPRKYATGSGGSVGQYARTFSLDRGLEILDETGKSHGKSAPATDVYIQAITRGKKVIDGIRNGKAVFKAGTHIAGVITVFSGAFHNNRNAFWIGMGLLALSALTNARADTRHWRQLPAEVHVLPLRLEPGRHTLEVRALNQKGEPLTGWRSTFEVDVPAGRNDLLYYFRTGQGNSVHSLPGQGSSIYGLTDHPAGG